MKSLNLKKVLPSIGFAFILVIGMFAYNAFTAFEKVSLFREHVSVGSCLDASDSSTIVSISAEATSSVTTNCAYIHSCVVSVESEAATTPVHLATCDIPDQNTAANRGKITVSGNNVGGTASGTTIISWMVFGYGSQ